MSGRDVPQPAAAADEEESVVAYLRRHPDLLARHPELLAALRVPHECGSAVSLVEYQVEALRGQCQELRGRLRTLVENARCNEELAQRVHRLVLSLVDSEGLDEIFATLYQGLEQGFGADLVSLRVFGDAAHAHDRGLGELVGARHAGKAHFGAIFESLQPFCGHPGGDALAFLFGERAAQAASAALVPLAAGDRRGVLAIASRSPARFQPTMGTLYLRQLADVLGRLLSRQVA